jgi:DnaJ homolog subfamily A member 2
MSGGEDLYGLLGVGRDAAADEIKKAFRKQVLTHHPDKGGDEETFKKLSRAYEVLSDPEKKQVYDMTGQVDDGAGGGGGGGFPGGFPFDLGSIFGGLGGMFGGMGGGGRPRRQPKEPPKVHDIPLKLEDYYKGRVLHVKFDRQKFCETCKGEGAASFQPCNVCQGRGVIHKVMQMGPMQMVSEGPCAACSTKGKIPKDACSACKGKKFFNQEKNLEVRIEAGMKPGDVLVFPGECSDHPDFDQPGDVHFVLREAEETEGKVWIRKGDNLETSVTITLPESLLGTNLTIQGHPGFPEGYTLELSPGVQNLEVVRKEGEGMVRRSGGKGDVLITVHIGRTAKDREVLARNKILLQTMFSG